MKYTTIATRTTTKPKTKATNNAKMNNSTTTATVGNDQATGKDNTNNKNSNSNSNINNNNKNNTNPLFCEQVCTVTNLFESWNDCERTVVMYALLKRLRYPSLKFLQYSIDNNLTQNLGSSQSSNLSTVIIDMNANNASYLQNLLNTYNNLHLSDAGDTLSSSSSSSDKDSMPCYGSDFQLTTHCEERKLYSKKEDILTEVLNMMPLLKPGNEEAKSMYLTLLPIAVKDTMQHIVSTELVQQIFSYLLIHPAITSDDRKSLNVWLRHLEEHIQSPPSVQQQQPPKQQNLFTQSSITGSGGGNLHGDVTSGSSAASSSTCSSVSCSSTSNLSIASSSMGNLASTSSSITTRNADWQTIAPPSSRQNKQHTTKQQQSKQPPPLQGWSSVMANAGPLSSSVSSKCTAGGGGASAGVVSSISSGTGSVGGSDGSIADQLCDNLNGITLNELASSQNSLGLSSSIGGGGVADSSASSLVNGVVSSLFGGNTTNPIINIINNNNNSNCNSNLNADDHDTSFSKNGTEILEDFEPHSCLVNNMNTTCDSSSNSSFHNAMFQQQLQPPPSLAAMLMNNCDMNRWSLDSKLAALKTRRSNSLTTQTISSASSSNSSVITVNDNCSNSTENLAQFANKPRSFSLSIVQQRANSGSDTRLDEFKPNYVKFQTHNIGMSSIGLWLKSLRLHKYIELFKNVTYTEMLQITEAYLQSLGVTKGASHKLALCIEKLKERSGLLTKMEEELQSGQMKVQAAIEELAGIVLTPMKPIDTFNACAGEENIALQFFQMIELVCIMLPNSLHNVGQEDEHISVIMWILDRCIHNEAFLSHVNQLKELKFRLSKFKIALGPKMQHHGKNGSSNGNLNKPRWSNKGRKLDAKNGSNDRINHRKNSNDMMNYNGGNNNNQQQQTQGDYHHIMKHHQQQPQQQQQLHHHHQQQQPPPQQLQQHRRSLNNLIVVTGGPQQAQKMIFKPGQGILPTTTTSADNLQMENTIKNQQRKASLTNLMSSSNNNNINNNNNNNCTNNNNNKLAAVFTQAVTTNAATTNTTNIDVTLQQQLKQSKKNMATVVMVSNNDNISNVLPQQSQEQRQQQQQQQPPPTQPPQHILNNNNNSSSGSNNLLNNNNLLCQQQHQLQLLAAAAAAVGNCCNNLNAANSNNIINCICSCCNNNNNNNGSNNNNSNCNNNCNNNNNNISNTNCNSSNCNSSSISSSVGGNRNNLAESLLKERYHQISATLSSSSRNINSTATISMNDIKSLEQLETLCLQMTEQAIN